LPAAEAEERAVFPAREFAVLETTLPRFFLFTAGEAGVAAFAEYWRPRKHESARSHDIVP
jgi:hypothetical protein